MGFVPVQLRYLIKMVLLNRQEEWVLYHFLGSPKSDDRTHDILFCMFEIDERGKL